MVLGTRVDQISTLEDDLDSCEFSAIPRFAFLRGRQWNGNISRVQSCNYDALDSEAYWRLQSERSSRLLAVGMASLAHEFQSFR